MTEEKLKERKDFLETRISELEDQLLSADANSASVSAGGGSKSYTNRSVADLKAKLAYARKELKKVNYQLGEGENPSAIKTVYVGFDA